MTGYEIHAHVATHSVDCDGAISTERTMWLNDAEKAHRDEADGVNDFHAIMFTDRVVASVVNAYSLMRDGRLTVRKLDDGDVRLFWSEPTEEGGRQVEATICTDDCAEDAYPDTYRDHRAEENGY